MQRLVVSVVALLAVTALEAQDVPKAEVFLGYNYVRMNGDNQTPSFSSNGGSAQLAVKMNKWVSGVFDFGGYHNGVVKGVNIDNTVFSFLAGPRVSIRNQSRVTPYFNALFGVVFATASTSVFPATLGSQAVDGRVRGSQDAFATALGGGMDVRITRHVSIRPVALDYFLTRLRLPAETSANNQHNLRYSAGINFTFGGEAPTPPPPPPPPAVRVCWDGSSVPVSSDCPLRKLAFGLDEPQKELCPGESLPVGPSGTLPDGATYQWTIDGQPISQGQSLDFGATGRAPGTYEVGLTVKTPGYEDASALTRVTVLPYRPPAGNLEVAPGEIWLGEQAAVNANVSAGQCGGALGPAMLSASEGAIRGGRFDSTGVQFDPADHSEQRKTVQLSAKAADQRGTGTAEATVVVKKPASVMAKRLPDVVFPENVDRVNNCGARVLLEELKSVIAADPAGRVVLVGHSSAQEKQAGLDMKRALNAAAMISGGQGVCLAFPSNRILLSAIGSQDNGVDYQSQFCGTSTIPLAVERPGQEVRPGDANAKYRRVEVWFVPSGGVLPPSLKDHTDAATLSVAALGCPR